MLVLAKMCVFCSLKHLFIFSWESDKKLIGESSNEKDNNVILVKMHGYTILSPEENASKPHITIIVKVTVEYV